MPKKINIDKSLKKAGKKIKNSKALPYLVSAGIPIASTALGALGTELGLPPEITSSLSENVMKEYIPKKYQTDNKYIGLLGDAISMGTSPDPASMMEFQQNLTGTIGKDLSRVLNKKNPLSTPTSEYYNPENPYNDLLTQMMKQQDYPIMRVPHESFDMPTFKPVNNIYDDNDNINYSNAELGEGSDSMIITSPPFQQKEGSVRGLLGAGMKKKRGRPRKNKAEIEVIIKKRLPHKKFSHGENSSLDQLLEALSEKEDKKAKDEMRTMVEKQTRLLTALGAGLKPRKGSNESKDKMAKLRAMKKNKK